MKSNINSNKLSSFEFESYPIKQWIVGESIQLKNDIEYSLGLYFNEIDIQLCFTLVVDLFSSKYIASLATR